MKQACGLKCKFYSLHITLHEVYEVRRDKDKEKKEERVGGINSDKLTYTRSILENIFLLSK